jgi:hypothetical protein
MGNRAVIAFGSTAKTAPAIYVHWNGGHASIEAFLRAAHALSIRGTDTRARNLVADAIRSFLQTSTYTGTYGQLDANNGDNGVYVVNSDLAIIKRVYKRGPEEIDAEKTRSIFDHIVSRAPVFNA